MTNIDHPTRPHCARHAAGHTVTVWNRTHAKTAPLVEKGARAAPTPAAAVKEAEFVISMLRDDDASRQVWLDVATGALAALPRSAVAIESSTVTVAASRGSLLPMRRF